MRSRECTHIQGQKADGKVCHAILTEPSDAYEWSFVAVPAQRKAGVSKSAKIRNDVMKIDTCDAAEIIKSMFCAEKGITLDCAQLKAVARYIQSMESDADSGREYRNQTQQEIISLAAFVLPCADTVMLEGILKKLDNDEVFMLKKAFDMKANDVNAYDPELSSETIKNFNDNSQFRI